MLYDDQHSQFGDQNQAAVDDATCVQTHARIMSFACVPGPCAADPGDPCMWRQWHRGTGGRDRRPHAPRAAIESSRPIPSLKMRPAATRRPRQRTAARGLLRSLYRLRDRTAGTASTVVVAAAVGEQPLEVGDLLGPQPASNSLSNGVGSLCACWDLAKDFTIGL